MNGLSREARALLAEVGESDGPSALRRARVKRQLAARLAAGGAVLGVAKISIAAAGGQSLGAAAAASAGAASAAGATTLGLGTIALWMAGGMALGTATMLPFALERGAAEPAPIIAPAAPPVAGLAERARPSRVQGPAVLPSAAAPIAAIAPLNHEVVGGERSGGRAAAVDVARPRSAQVETASPAPSAEPLAFRALAPSAAAVGAETQLLESAQRELAAGNGQRALELLGEHERDFPTGALGEERMFARVIALCQMGSAAEARAAAEVFLRAAPRSPFVARLRKSCAFAEEREPATDPAR